jgi:hypothetical protein
VQSAWILLEARTKAHDGGGKNRPNQSPPNYRIGGRLKSIPDAYHLPVFQNAGAKAVVPGKGPENRQKQGPKTGTKD